MQPPLVERILAQLARAEAAEPNPHFRDDYRIAWITVLCAARGEPAPHVAASYIVLGVHPNKVWQAIGARRHAQLGHHYQEFFGVELPPKKPARSARWVGDKIGRVAA